MIKGKGTQKHHNQQHPTSPNVNTLAVISFGSIAAVDELRRHVHGRSAGKGHAGKRLSVEIIAVSMARRNVAGQHPRHSRYTASSHSVRRSIALATMLKQLEVLANPGLPL